MAFDSAKRLIQYFLILDVYSAEESIMFMTNYPVKPH